MSGSLLIHDAELDGRRVDVTCSAGTITAVAPTTSRYATGSGADDVLDAAGMSIIPGLHDHHIHLLATAAAMRSVQVGPPDVTTGEELVAALRAASRQLAPGEWIRAVGYHESVAGPIDGDWLDALGIGRPIRVQHRSGALWILNTSALHALDLVDASSVAVGAGEHVEVDASGRLTGRLYRADALLRRRLGPEGADTDVPATGFPDLAALGRRLARLGITGVTDLTPTSDPAAVAALAAARRSGALPIAVTITGSADLPAEAEPGVPRGPVKIVIDDHELPPLDWVVAEFARARATRRPIAVHSVTRESLVLALAAWQDVGALPGDRIEHGAVIPVELIDEIGRRQLTVVTQPSFVRDRGDQYLTDVERHDLADLWRCGSLIDHDVGVVFGSDAPYGDIDPWNALRAATERRTAGGAPLGRDERISPVTAFQRFLGTATDAATTRRVQPGFPADLCLLDRPLAEQLDDPTADAVVATVVAGVAVHHH